MECIDQGARVFRGHVDTLGGCNTCTRETEYVWVIRGVEQVRNFEYRMCDACIADLKRQVK